MSAVWGHLDHCWGWVMRTGFVAGFSALAAVGGVGVVPAQAQQQQDQAATRQALTATTPSQRAAKGLSGAMAQTGSPETTSASTDHRGRSESIRSGLHLVSEFFSEDVLLAVHSVAEDPRTWHTVLRDPREFFTSSGIDIPDGVFIRFLEAPPIESADAPQISEPRQDPQIQCPLGLVPTAVVVANPQRCKKLMEWHVDLSIPPDGSPDGHGWFCIDYDVSMEVQWVCSSLITATATKAE
jgi:hypothetical protein